MAEFRGVIKGTLVKGLTPQDDDFVRVLDPGGSFKPEGAPWFLPVRLFESIEPLSEEST